MQCTVKYTNGEPSQDFESIQAAAQALLAQYPDGVIYDAGGFDCDEDTTDSAYDVRSGRAALAWETAEDAINDDGGNAVAEIEVPEQRHYAD